MRCDGIELGLSVCGGIHCFAAITLGRSGLELLVKGDSKTYPLGSGCRSKENSSLICCLVADTIQVHRYRAVKEFYGILCLLIVCLWVIREWSVSGEGLNRA